MSDSDNTSSVEIDVFQEVFNWPQYRESATSETLVLAEELLSTMELVTEEHVDTTLWLLTNYSGTKETLKKFINRVGAEKTHIAYEFLWEVGRLGGEGEPSAVLDKNAYLDFIEDLANIVKIIEYTEVNSIEALLGVIRAATGDENKYGADTEWLAKKVFEWLDKQNEENS